jgi:predicted nucleic acid-binding protein
MLVLDASLTIAAVLKDESSEAAQAILTRASEANTWVPSLWRLEVANVLRNAVRRGRCDQAFSDATLEDLGNFPIVLDPETDNHAWGATLALSREEGLTLYDAAYLELAIRLNATLASCDADLLAAARRRGLDVLTV